MNCIGNNDVNFIAAIYLSLVHNLRADSTGLAVGNKQTVLVQRTKRIIGQGPFGCFRDFSSTARNVSANCGELNRAVRSVILCLSSYICANEGSVGGSRSNKTDTGGRGTLTTVRRRVVDLQFLTGTPGNKGGGAAAVTVSCPYTAGRNHDLCQLIHIHTLREGALTAIILHNNDLSISGNAHYRTRLATCMRGAVLVHTVFNNVSAGDRNNRVFPTVKVRGCADLYHFQLGNVCRSCFTVRIGILVDYNAGGEADIAICVTAVTGIEHDLAIEHHKAQRLTNAIGRISGIPGQAAVHHANDLAFHVVVNPLRLIVHSGSLIHRSVHFCICRNNRNILIAYISGHHMDNLTLSTCIVIQNDLSFADTGSIVPVPFGNQIVIVI